MLDHGMIFAFSWFHSGCEASCFFTFSCKNRMYSMTCIKAIVDGLVKYHMGTDYADATAAMSFPEKNKMLRCLTSKRNDALSLF